MRQTDRSRSHRLVIAAAAVAAALAAPWCHASATVRIGSAAALPGGAAAVAVTLAGGGAPCALALDLVYDPAALTVSAVEAGAAAAAAGKQVATSQPAFGVLRIGVLGGQSTLGDGTVATVRFAVAATAQGQSMLSGSAAVASCAGVETPVPVTPGTVSFGACTLSCAASVPAGGAAGEAVGFGATVTATGCAGAVAYDWDFGDGGAHAAEQSPSHVYASAGTYAWTLSVSADGQTCTKTGSIAVTAPAAAHVYVVPSVAHQPGTGGTQWRTDVGVVNRNAQAGAVTVTYYGAGAPVVRSASVAAGGTVEWVDVVAGLLGVTGSGSGTLHVGSDVPLVVTSRTYNQASAGTFGQYYPALAVGDALAAGQVGVLGQVKKTGAFRTNVGVVNLGTSSCTVAVRLWGGAGAALGGVKTVTAAAGRWVQVNDIFAACAAGSQEIAYATVEVQTAGGTAWAYASVVDNATGDPTTIPVLVPATASGPAVRAVAAPPAAAITPAAAVLAGGVAAAGPAAAAAPPAAGAALGTEVVFSDGFEVAFPGSAWDVRIAGNTGWGRSTQRVAAGSASVWCAGGGASPSAPGGEYVSAMNTWMIYGPFSLAGATAARATFSYWMKSEAEWSTYGDPFSWMISIDGTHFYGFKNSGDSAGWTSGELDVAAVTAIAALGQPQVWFAFLFKSDVGLQYEGVYVDDLRIERTTSGQTCTLSCAASVPAGGAAGEAVGFGATVTATGCAGAVAYDWDFGDGGAHAAEQSPSHVYASAGTYAWTLSVSADGQTCTKTGSIAVTAPAAAHVYVVPSVAHQPGTGGTQWRTDVGVVNRNAQAGAVTVTYYGAGAPVVRSASVAAGGTVEWVDVVAGLLGVTGSGSGTLHVGSDVPLVVTSRTYNQASAGTFGQYYPALAVGDALAAGQVGVLGQVKKTGAFRTNVGVVNLGTSSCTVAVRLWGGAGAALGGVKTVTAAAGRWVQVNDIFAACAAGSQEIAYATVEVQTAGGKAWAYASVVDNATGDPTTIPVRTP